MAKIFRGALFGYNKKDVQKYVESMSENFQAQLGEYDAEIESLKAQWAQMEEERTLLETKKDAISEAIISAQEKSEAMVAEAEKQGGIIISEARKESENILAEARQKAEDELEIVGKKIAEENQKLIKIRRDITNIRRNAIKALNSLEASNEEDQ